MGVAELHSRHSTDRPSICLFYVHHGLFVAPLEQAMSVVSINRQARLSPRGDRKGLSSGIRSFLLFLLNSFLFFFFVIITVNNGVVGDRRYHRCNALLMVSDSCGRRV